jgi:hypothetical protein
MAGKGVGCGIALGAAGVVGSSLSWAWPSVAAAQARRGVFPECRKALLQTM